MSKYRIKGEYGNNNITVFTEWLEIPYGEVLGVKAGLEISGWTDCEIQSEGSDE